MPGLTVGKYLAARFEQIGLKHQAPFRFDGVSLLPFRSELIQAPLYLPKCPSIA